ncbi:hypothetical protein OG21DRAFT_1516957 [Imleria badia]|nr:hypothetical protein OG21DRAFT_1516957 [Imleria badia]
MALRKLDKVLKRQGQELKHAQARVQTPENELEEAWREAEKMAIELARDCRESAQEDTPDPRTGLDLKHGLDETGTLGDVTIHTDIAVVLGVTTTAVASPNFPSTNQTPSPSARHAVSARPAMVRVTSPASLLRASGVAPPPTQAYDSPRPSVPHRRHIHPPSTHRPSLRCPLSNPTLFSTWTMSRTNTSEKPFHPHVPYPFSSSYPCSRVHTAHPGPTLALPTPLHSAGLPPTRVPSIWLETDACKSTRLNALDRS